MEMFTLRNIPTSFFHIINNKHPANNSPPFSQPSQDYFQEIKKAKGKQ